MAGSTTADPPTSGSGHVAASGLVAVVHGIGSEAAVTAASALAIDTTHPAGSTKALSATRRSLAVRSMRI